MAGSGSGDLDLVPDPELFIHYSDSEDTGEIIQADPIVIRSDYGERSGINTNHCNHLPLLLTRTLQLIEDSAITTCSRYSWRVLTARGAPLRNNCAKPRTELDKTSRLESWNIYITTIRSVMHIMYTLSILNDKVGFTQSRNLWELQFIAITSFLGNTIRFRKVTQIFSNLNWRFRCTEMMRTQCFSCFTSF